MLKIHFLELQCTGNLIGFLKFDFQGGNERFKDPSIRARIIYLI